MRLIGLVSAGFAGFLIGVLLTLVAVGFVDAAPSSAGQTSEGSSIRLNGASPERSRAQASSRVSEVGDAVQLRVPDVSDNGDAPTTASTERDTARPHEPTRTSPGLASSPASSRCGSADGVSRRSPRGTPPLREGSKRSSHRVLILELAGGAADLVVPDGVAATPIRECITNTSSRRVCVSSLADITSRKTTRASRLMQAVFRIGSAAFGASLRGSERIVRSGCPWLGVLSRECHLRISCRVSNIYPSVDNVNPLLSGTATWYCGNGSPCTVGYQPSDMVAAIDPSLGIPKGTWLTVRHGSRSVEVVAVDVCACPGRRVIDLTSGAFSRLAPLSAGVIQVELEEVGATATLPATDR